jgi:uncharacterized membrane protein YfcA
MRGLEAGERFLALRFRSQNGDVDTCVSQIRGRLDARDGDEADPRVLQAADFFREHFADGLVDSAHPVGHSTPCSVRRASRSQDFRLFGVTRAHSAGWPSAIFNRLDALLLVGVAIWCFVTAVAGGLVGLVLGNIRLPVIVLVASSPAAGAGANIGISAVAALAAAVTHVRAGRIDWRVFAWMTPPSVGGAVAGGLLSGAIPGDALLIAIGATLLVFGVDLLRPRRSTGSARPEETSPAAAVLSGAVIGLLGGFVGLILGALRIGALLRFVGADAFRAVGTNVAVGFCLGVAGVLGHLTSGVDWTLLALGAGASVPGSLLGARLTGRLAEDELLRAVGAILLVAGTATILQGIL